MSSTTESFNAPNRNKKAPQTALLLGYAGLTFLAGAVFSLPIAASLWPWGNMLLLNYAAIILSFMGGVHWGVAMLPNPIEKSRMVKSVIPSLAALIGIVIGGNAGLMILAIGFIGLLFYDEVEARKGHLTDWYPLLRRPLTTTVVLCLLAGLAA